MCIYLRRSGLPCAGSTAPAYRCPNSELLTHGHTEWTEAKAPGGSSGVSGGRWDDTLWPLSAPHPRKPKPQQSGEWGAAAWRVTQKPEAGRARTGCSWERALERRHRPRGRSGDRGPDLGGQVRACPASALESPRNSGQLGRASHSKKLKSGPCLLLPQIIWAESQVRLPLHGPEEIMAQEA